MYINSSTVYMEEPTKKQLADSKKIMKLYSGPASCLLEKHFAPEPRVHRLRPDEHATHFFTHEDVLLMERWVKKNSPPAVVAGRLPKRRKPPLVHEVYCGCKFYSGSAWRQPKSGNRFNSESAFSYHIFSKGASCLPLDVANREAFVVHPNRTEFIFLG